MAPRQPLAVGLLRPAADTQGPGTPEPDVSCISSASTASESGTAAVLVPAMAVAAGWLLLWPRGYQRLAEPVLAAVSDSSVLRVLGGLGVLFGLGVAWLAFTLNGPAAAGP